MLFVADLIPNELRRIVEFLNEQMDPAEVFGGGNQAVCWGRAENACAESIRADAEAEKKKGGGRVPGKKLDENTFLEALATNKGPGGG